MFNKNLTIIVPCKNEAENLKFLLPKLKSKAKDVLVIDASSKDGTKQICKANRVRYYTDDGNGKGSAQRIAVKKAKYENIIFFDGDGAPNINDISKINNILNKGYDLVICSRQTGGSYDLDYESGFKSAVRASGVIFLVILFNKLFKTTFTDILYSFKGIKKKKFFLIKTEENGFAIEIDILIRAIRKKLKIIEMPSRENKRKFGISKLPTIQGLYFIFFILKKYFY